LVLWRGFGTMVKRKFKFKYAMGKITQIVFLKLKNNFMSQVKENNTVKVHYVGKLSDGQVFDTSEGKEPLEFTLGQGKLIAGFEKGLIDMKINEKRLPFQKRKLMANLVKI
jgi:FKBP-type peptidyl-prolyl cis-trans isomerase